MTQLYDFSWNRIGARFYDPDLGIWISQDPAHQYLNPYGFTSNPFMNIDPNGLWSLGLGVVVGYDKHGWNFGFGAAADVRLTNNIGLSLDASHSWSTDGSETTKYSAGASLDFKYVGFDVGASYTENTKDGVTKNYHLGANVVAIGGEIGRNQAWDASGNYLGKSDYAEGYLGLRGVASYGIGYEWGTGQFHRGYYETATFMLNSWSEHGHGWHYDGFEYNFNVVGYKSNDGNNAKLLTQKDDIIGHSAITGNFAGESFAISVGPGGRDVGTSLMGALSFIFPQTGDAEYTTHEGEDANETVDLNNVNIGKLYRYSQFIGALGEARLLPYDIFTACSFYTSAGIAYSGGFGVGGNFSPYFMDAIARYSNYYFGDK